MAIIFSAKYALISGETLYVDSGFDEGSSGTPPEMISMREIIIAAAIRSFFIKAYDRTTFTSRQKRIVYCCVCCNVNLI